MLGWLFFITFVFARGADPSNEISLFSYPEIAQEMCPSVANHTKEDLEECLAILEKERLLVEEQLSSLGSINSFYQGTPPSSRRLDELNRAILILEQEVNPQPASVLVGFVITAVLVVLGIGVGLSMSLRG